MSEPGPLLPLTKLDGSKIHVHIDRIVKVTPSAPQPATESGPEHESGSTITVATGTGAIGIDVSEHLLNLGAADQLGYLLLTDLHEMPIMINPTCVVLVRAHEPAGTLLEVCSTTGTEEIYVRDDFDRVGDRWTALAKHRRLVDPGVHW